MQKDKREKRSKKGSNSPIDALHEERFRELPANEKQLAEKTARLADLCQYFSERRIDVPAEIVERISGLKLPVPECVRALVDVNHDLMEYLNTASDLGSRQ